MERIQQLLLCLSIPSVVTNVNVIEVGKPGVYNDARRYCSDEMSSFLKWNDLSNNFIIAKIRRLTREREADHVYFWIDDCKDGNGTWIFSSKNNCIYGLVQFKYTPPKKLCRRSDCGEHLHNLCKTKELYPDSTQPTGASTNDKNSKPQQENKKNTEQGNFSVATISLALVLVILLCVVAVLCQKYKTKKDKGNDRNLGTQGMDERIINEDTGTEAGAACSKHTEYAESVDDGIYSKTFSEQQYNTSSRDNGKEEPAYDHIASYYRNVASVLIENDTCRFNHSRSLAINENCYYNTTLKR